MNPSQTARETRKRKTPPGANPTGLQFLKLTGMVGNKATFGKPVSRAQARLWFTFMKRSLLDIGGAH